MGFENINETLSSDLTNRIQSGLVRLEDIIEGKPVYHGITEEDYSLIIGAYQHGIAEGIEHNDLIESLKTIIGEIGPIMPTTSPMKPPVPPKPAGTAPMTPNAPQQPNAAANVQIGMQPQTPVNPQNLEKEIGDKLKDPTFGKDFAELLARVMQRK